MSEAITDDSVDNQNLEPPEVSTDEKTEGECDVTPVESASADPNSESTQHSTSTRRLRRINKAPEEVRTAKRAEVTKNRSGSASSNARKSVKKASEIVGMSLAEGRYNVKSQLGKGSMAYVFLAGDSRLETDVVIKVPKPEIVSTNDFRERFKRETQLLVKFSHPHVVSVLDIGEFEELPFVVMQLLSGGSLADQMKEKSNDKGQMSPESLKEWLPGVARALDFCYRKGMVHRDVKPANILFDEDDNAFVADFGLSKVMYGDHVEMNSSETAAGIVLGTPNYISPEIVLAKEYDGRADQYSLGITVYHALLGRAPMQGQSATATMVNQTQKQLQLLSDIRSDVPEALAKAVRKSIEKKPENRFESCEAFAEAVVDSLRSDASLRMAATNTSPATPGEADSSKASNASARRKSPRKKNRSSSSGKRKSPVAGGDMDWLNIATVDAALPPKKGQKRSSKAKKPNKPAPGTLKVFGQDVSLPVAAVSGSALAGVLLFAVLSLFSGDADVVPSHLVDASPTVAQDKNGRGNAGVANTSAVGNASRKKSPAKTAQNRGEKEKRSGKNNQNGNKKQVASSSKMLSPGTGGGNIWKYFPPDKESWGKNAENGVLVTASELPVGIAGDPNGFEVTVEGENATSNWAQFAMKGADFLRDARMQNAASRLTIEDLDRLEIEFDFSIPGSLAVVVFLESGPRNGNWLERSIKVDDSLRDNPMVDGHAIIRLSDAPATLEEKAGFLRTMNSDPERADFRIRLGIQGRSRKNIPNDSFIIRNVVVRIR